MAYADLPPIRVDADGEHWGVKAGSARAEAQRIPLLSEVLACIPAEKPLIIEFKQKEEVRHDGLGVLGSGGWVGIGHTRHLITNAWFTLPTNTNKNTGFDPQGV